MVWELQPAGREWTGWLKSRMDGQQHESWNTCSCRHLRIADDEGARWRQRKRSGSASRSSPGYRRGRCTSLTTPESSKSIGNDCRRLGNVNGDCKEGIGGGYEEYARMCQIGMHSDC